MAGGMTTGQEKGTRRSQTATNPPSGTSVYIGGGAVGLAVEVGRGVGGPAVGVTEALGVGDGVATGGVGDGTGER